MILEFEIGALLAVNVFSLALTLGEKLRDADEALVGAPAAPAAPAVTPTPAAAPVIIPGGAHVEIVKKRGEDWTHVGHRHATHPDVFEALATPGLALRHVDGRIEEGTSCL